MFSRKTPQTLDQLLAGYRHVDFANNGQARKDMLHNFLTTRKVAEIKISESKGDAERSTIYCKLREECWDGERSCKNSRSRVDQLRHRYDNFVPWVILMFLLSENPNLARRVATAL